MVRLNKIYTRTGDDGTTGLAAGPRRMKNDLRLAAIGTVDEVNAALGVVRLATVESDFDPVLSRIQNDLFDLGADLATPETGEPLGYEPLRIVASQVARLESEIDRFNAPLSPLKSFVLPAGAPAAAHLHLARTVCRRAERLVVELRAKEPVGDEAVRYLNRLSDLLFVLARAANARAGGDVLWVPGGER
jgi:cob(I)alamin adenosyltransferase